MFTRYLGGGIGHKVTEDHDIQSTWIIYKRAHEKETETLAETQEGVDADHTVDHTEPLNERDERDSEGSTQTKNLNEITIMGTAQSKTRMLARMRTRDSEAPTLSWIMTKKRSRTMINRGVQSWTYSLLIGLLKWSLIRVLQPNGQ
jgi:hypothetical protein